MCQRGLMHGSRDMLHDMAERVIGIAADQQVYLLPTARCGGRIVDMRDIFASLEPASESTADASVEKLRERVSIETRQAILSRFRDVARGIDDCVPVFSLSNVAQVHAC